MYRVDRQDFFFNATVFILYLLIYILWPNSSLLNAILISDVYEVTTEIQPIVFCKSQCNLILLFFFNVSDKLSNFIKSNMRQSAFT